MVSIMKRTDSGWEQTRMKDLQVGEFFRREGGFDEENIYEVIGPPIDNGKKGFGVLVVVATTKYIKE